MSIAKQLNISDRVQFFEEIWDANLLSNLFSKAIAYVSPGHVGLGVLHSFSYGVPVVTSAVAKHAQEFYDLKDGHNSLLFNDFMQLKEYLITLCHDKGVAKKLGRNAFLHYSENRQISNMAKGFLDAVKS
jgi:glycosyltransferase involved in cell wall biosynthesis